jgi:hypothetical protein
MLSRGMAFLSWLLLGCVHRVDVVSVPSGATVAWLDRAGQPMPDLPEQPVPAQLRLRPFGPRRVRVSLPDHRTVDVAFSPGLVSWEFVTDVLLARPDRLWGRAPARVVEVRLVEEHGGVGTWAPGDVPRR